MKFKVGDTVKSKSAYTGPIIGTIVEIKSETGTGMYLCRFPGFHGHNGNGITKRGKDYSTRDHWYLEGDMLELIETPKMQPIVIYRKGNEVIAFDKNTGKTGIARCCPDDEFDFQTGAKLAFERLMVPQVKEVERYAKPGEYIKIVNPAGCSPEEYKKGDILKVVKYSGDYTIPGMAYYKDEIWKYAEPDEYVVLEGYEPKQEDHPFKVGDIVRGKAGSSDYYMITNEDMTKAEVLGVSNDGKCIDVKIMDYKGGMFIGRTLRGLDSKYFELVEATEETSEETSTYYNGKIIFTNGNNAFKTGHIYEIKDGQIRHPWTGTLLPNFPRRGYTRFNSIEDVKDYFSAKSPLHDGYGWSNKDLELIEVVDD